MAGEYLELAKKQIYQQWREASEAFRKASEIDPKADVIWARLADCYGALAGFEAGTSREAEFAKACLLYTSAIWATAIMPSRVATCASCGVPSTTSPMA